MRAPYLAFILAILMPYTLHAEAKKIKIGAVASLSGAAEQPGKGWLEGAQLAAKELSEEGIPVELVVEDDHTNPTQAVSAFTRLVTVEEVSTVIGGTWDFLAAALYPVARMHKVPFITVSNPVELVAEQLKDNPYGFTNSISLESESKAVDRFLARHTLHRAALVYIDVPYGEVHQAMLSKKLTEHAIPIVYSQAVPFQGMLDGLRRAALGCVQKKADFVFLVFDGDGTDQFLREAERLQHRFTVLTTQGLDKGFELSGHAARYEGIAGIYPPSGTTTFRQRFEKHYGHAPKDFAAGAYDAVQFVARAARASVSLISPKERFSWQGVTGEHFVPAENHEIAHQQAVLMSVLEGTFQEE